MNIASPNDDLRLQQEQSPEHKVDLFSSPMSASNIISQDQAEPVIKTNGLEHIPFSSADLVPNAEPVPGPSRSRKRKRKQPPQPEETCWKCRRPMTNNSDGAHEQLLSCFECGQSEHPSCTGKDGRWARSWDWVCQGCKNCEICAQAHVNDGELLSCGRCDRGWHLSCLDATGSYEPAGLPDCPECRPPSNDASKAPSFTLRPVQGTPSLGKRSESPLAQLTGTTIARRRSRKQESISSFVSHSRLTPVDPPKTTAVSEPEQKISTVPIKAAGDSQKPKTLPPIKLRLPPRKKGEPPAESPKRRAFEEILTVAEADTSTTTIGTEDKARFERSRNTAEARLGVPLVPPPGTPAGISTPVQQPQTPKALPNLTGSPLFGPRLLKTALSQPHLLPSTPTPSTPKAYPLAPSVASVSGTTPLRIKSIRIGVYEVDTWYDAPFPEEYAAVPEGKLYMCEFCLKYMKSPFGAERHRTKCTTLHPPGDEVYRDGNISIFEVDGRLNKIYCQNLCLLSKMFLDHKSLFYDVEPFLFYVMTEVDANGAHFVGYFSKEKRSPKDFNVSCIMTLPVRQKSGWGNLLIDFSYLLTLKEGRYGTPERPLSKLGAIAYGRYWQLAVYKVLRNADPDGNLRMEDICRETRMTLEDVFNTLRTNGLISLTATPSTPQNGRDPSTPGSRSAVIVRKNLIRKNSSNPKLYAGSQSGISVYDLTAVPTQYTIHWDRRAIREFLEKIEAKGLAKLRPENLRWTPYLIGRVRKNDSRSEEASGTSHWGLELEDMPEPTMHSHTPLEPVERPPPPPRSNSGLKTPRRNGNPGSSRPGSTARARARRDDSPVTSVGQLSIGEWRDEPMEEDDDDEFRDDASTSPELRRPLRQRSSGYNGRLLTRSFRVASERAGESDLDANWKDPSDAPLRTRSGKILASASADSDFDSDSDWERGAITRRTRSKSHTTKSTRRDESLAPSHSELGSEFEDEANVQEQLGLGNSAESFTSRILSGPSKKRAKRVITSESGDDVANDDAQIWEPSAEPVAVNGHVEESEATPHMQSEVHALTNGVVSDDQSPETPQVLAIEEQHHVGPSVMQTRHQQGDGAFEWVQASYNTATPQFHDLGLEHFGAGVGFRPIDTTAAPLLQPVGKMDAQPQATLVNDDTMAMPDQPWSSNQDMAVAMDTCDEDAEGEDEDAEGEEDLTLMA